jgi:hypothetical protein
MNDLSSPPTTASAAGSLRLAFRNVGCLRLDVD